MNKVNKKSLCNVKLNKGCCYILKHYVSSLSEAIYDSLNKSHKIPIELCGLIVSFSDPCLDISKRVRIFYNRGVNELRDIEAPLLGGSYGVTPLHEAVENQNLDHMRFMMGFHFLNLEAEDGLGFTALCLAIKEENTKILNLLMDSGAKFNGRFRTLLQGVRICILQSKQVIIVL